MDERIVVGEKAETTEAAKPAPAPAPVEKAPESPAPPLPTPGVAPQR